MRVSFFVLFLSWLMTFGCSSNKTWDVLIQDEDGPHFANGHLLASTQKCSKDATSEIGQKIDRGYFDMPILVSTIIAWSMRT